MKKNYYVQGEAMFFPCLKKLLLVMKLTIGVIILFVFQATAAISQNTVSSIHANNMELDRFFSEIEKQTSVKFLYRYDNIAGKQVSLDVDNVSVENLLDIALRGQGLTYSKKSNNLIVISSTESNQQSRKISGTVKDVAGLPLPGVTILIKGTTSGTVSDMDGKFSLNIPGDQNVLVFSFVGYTPQEISVGAQSNYSIVLKEEEHAIDEVVVTALGIEKSKKSLTYATQLVNVEDLASVRDVSLGNALAGKVAGVSVTASTGTSGVSGDPRIVIRGDRTINGNNQPLIVVDGNPYSQSGGGLSSINPDDIVSMNVLKGPAASALYGSSAQNGVIVITTKKGKMGEAKVEINSVTTFDLPYLYPEIQNVYGQGVEGVFQSNSEVFSWGPKMTGQTVTDWTGKQTTLDPQPNNMKDFFETGYNMTNSMSYSTGTEKSTAYFSYNNTTAKSVLADNKMQRHNFNLRLTTDLLKNLNLDFKITWFRQHLNDKPVTGDDLFSPMHQLIRMPRSIRTSDIKAGSYFDASGSQKQITWAPGSTGIINPYWSMYGYEAPSTSNSINSLLVLKYRFTDWLYLQLRGGMGVGNSDSEKKTYWDTQYINSGKGNYYKAFSRSESINGDILLGFNKKLSEDFNLSINLGAEIRDSRGSSIESNTGELSTENKFSLNYATKLTSTDGESRIQRQSVYGMAQLGFRNYLFLDVTSRNDWSSTLPAPYDYFYPSVGVTGVVSDMVALPEFISFAKLRGSYAEVGNDAGWAMIFQTYGRDAQGPAGMIYPSGTRVPVNLIPEKTKSWETGAELRFLENRLSIDFTWYKSNTYNQLVNVTTAPSSGYSSGWINCGNIQNKGIEVLLVATPVKTDNFVWDIDLNFTKNKNKVIELTETLDKYEISSPNLSIGETWALVGRPFGEIFTKGFVRNEAGQVVVDATGLPGVQADYDTYLGNFNYDWRSGITNSLRYKNWYMSFLIDLNYGGVRQSATEAQMMYSGTSKESLYGRDGFIYPGVKAVTGTDGSVSYVENDKVITAQTYGQLIGGRTSNGCGEAYNHEATNSRLRELSIGYTIPVRSSVVKGLRVSAVGRNLFYIYNACKWFDPDVTYDVERNGQGAESAFLPGTRTIGFNIKLTL